jgi:stalled ribosome rescue protein Dom34
MTGTQKLFFYRIVMISIVEYQKMDLKIFLEKMEIYYFLFTLKVKNTIITSIKHMKKLHLIDLKIGKISKIFKNWMWEEKNYINNCKLIKK